MECDFVMKIFGISFIGLIFLIKFKFVNKVGGQSFFVDMLLYIQVVVNIQVVLFIQLVDVILVLQLVGDFIEVCKCVMECVFDMLDVFDELKLVLLEGGFLWVKLEVLMKLFQMCWDDINDVQLEVVLNEVEICVVVELVKFG